MELVITITILGIIAAVAMPRMARSQQVRQAFNVESAIRGQLARARDRAMLTGRPQGVAFFGPGSILDPGSTSPAQITIYDNVGVGLVNVQTQRVSTFDFADPLWVDATPGNGSGMGPGWVAGGGSFLPMLDVPAPTSGQGVDSAMIFDVFGQPNSFMAGVGSANVVSVSNVRVVGQPIRVQYSVPGVGNFRAEIAPLSGEMGPATGY